MFRKRLLLAGIVNVRNIILNTLQPKGINILRRTLTDKQNVSKESLTYSEKIQEKGKEPPVICCCFLKPQQIWSRLPCLKAVVLYNDSLPERHPNLYTMEEFMELGNEIPDATLNDIISSQKPNQCCVLVYTSGTTGKPKGAMLSHDNITWTAAHASRAGDMQPAEIQQEIIVSYLPLSHIAAQIYDLWTGIKWGEQIYFAEPDALKGSLVNTLKEAQPTSHMGVPRVWEKIMEKLKDTSAQSGFMKKKMLSWAMSISLERNLSCSGSTLDPDTSDPTDNLSEQAREFCQKIGSKAMKVSEIVATRDQAVYQAIQEGIDRVNMKSTASVQHIQKWTVLERDFSISGGEFGPTMKLKRPAVLEKYKDEINSFYKE
ncbi:long-chain-fatty-acid--CoA ligase ACSBG1 [Terrapene carolina triunguis]|uniref:long-chain-fatty-acid--CoA ligase ACSBG1 n=1 Tax=Terrapene triunguis TaxID=2587831 RepID=UPI0011565524|nr:long-chain-fatty-acid--CoA ligase ACSBG1 [Terrapene carolina triunguis]